MVIAYNDSVNQYTSMSLGFMLCLHYLIQPSYTVKVSAMAVTTALGGDTEVQRGSDLLKVTQVVRGRVVQTCCNVAHRNNTLMEVSAKP